MAPKPIHHSPTALAVNTGDVDFPDRTARYVCEFYHSLRTRGGTPQSNQWTVLAAFLLYTKPLDSKAQGSLSILTIATGNKCVAVPTERDKQVIDMHAEILARRELELLLLDGMAVQDMDTIQDSRLSLSERFALDALQSLISSRAALYMYSSHMPCGFASDVAHLDRLDREDQILNQVMWGDVDTPDRMKSTFRSDRGGPVPQLSKKPSRADAEPTSAYSCSDKLSRYQVLGLQGGRLGRIFEERNWPFIRLAGIIVGEDFLVGKGLQALFGGTVQTSTAAADLEKSYSRMVDGISAVFEGYAESSFLKRFHLDLLQTTANFRIFGTDHVFNHSRQATQAQHRSEVSLTEQARNAFERLSLHEQSRVRCLPLALARDLVLHASPAQSFPISTHWRAGQDVQVLNPSGILNGHKVTKPIMSSSTSRVCRAHMAETCRLIKDPVDKGGEKWKRVSDLMESKGPWKDWHKFV
jgi:hypothetical protein